MSRCVATRVLLAVVLAFVVGAAGIALGAAWAWACFQLADIPGATDGWREGMVVIGETLGQLIAIMVGFFGPPLIAAMLLTMDAWWCADA